MSALLSYIKVPDAELHLELFRRRDFDFITVNESTGDLAIDEDGRLIRKHLKQEQALFALTDAIHSEIVYGGAAGGSKSWTGCAWLAFACKAFPGTKWFIGREELKAIKDSTLLTFRRVCKAYGIIEGEDWKYYTTDHYIQFTNGSRIDLLELKYKPSDDPLFERFGSKEYTGGWIEEGGEIHFGAFDTLKSRVGRMMNDYYGLIGKIFVTCNPKKNWLYTHFYKAAKNLKLKAYQLFIGALVTDNPFIEKGYIENLHRMTDVARKERLLNGNWDYDDDPACLLTFDKISDMFTNQHVLPTGTRYITADIARQGEDCTRIYVWDGMVCFRRVTIEKSGTDVVEKRIRDLANEYGIPMSRTIVDADGVGGGVADHLKCQEMFNASKAFDDKRGKKENFPNKRAQLYYKAAEIIKEAGMFIKDCDGEEREEISLEMGVIKKKDVDSETNDIIPRKDIKALIGRSPDHATNIMLRMWFEYATVKFSKPKTSF